MRKEKVNDYFSKRLIPKQGAATATVMSLSIPEIIFCPALREKEGLRRVNVSSIETELQSDAKGRLALMRSFLGASKKFEAPNQPFR